jgi:hypothetical protein
VGQHGANASFLVRHVRVYMQGRAGLCVSRAIASHGLQLSLYHAEAPYCVPRPSCPFEARGASPGGDTAPNPSPPPVFAAPAPELLQQQAAAALAPTPK